MPLEGKIKELIFSCVSEVYSKDNRGGKTWRRRSGEEKEEEKKRMKKRWKRKKKRRKRRKKKESKYIVGSDFIQIST